MSIQGLIKYFIYWRMALFAILFFSLSIWPLQFNFLGGGLSQYLEKPYLWGWLNFDGEHYFSIAQNGYHPLEYYFFPLFPLLVRGIANLMSRSVISMALIGLVINHILLFVALYGLGKLLRIDYKNDIATYVVILLFLFPTSFYFVSYFTESLFLSCVIWSFYFARKRVWILAGILAACATGTRIVGVALLPALFVEAILQNKRKISSYLIPLISIASGAIGILWYMYFMYGRTGTAFAFFNSLNSVYGQQRSDTFVILPQVLYRYFFKILPVIDYSYFPQVFSTYLEIGVGLLFLYLSILAFFKLRASYAVYLACGYLIPTLSGSYSSFPRYALVLFPGFILMGMYLQKMPTLFRYSFYLLSAVLLFVSLTLFIRGYWIS